MILRTVAALLIFGQAFAQRRSDFGNFLGSLDNSTFALKGDVYWYDEDHLQIIDFHLDDISNFRWNCHFTLANDADVKFLDVLQEYIPANSRTGALDYRRPLRDPVLKGQFANQRSRLIVEIPKSTGRDWLYFGIASKDKWFFLSAVTLDPTKRPDPALLPALRGRWYNVSSGPIRVLNQNTLKVPAFSFEGSKPPDGWFFAGRGQVDKATGKKAWIVGRDDPSFQCSMRDDYRGTQDLVVKLAQGQSVYDIDYFGVYCVAVGVDFGHIGLRLDRRRVQLPPPLPPVSDEPVFQGRDIGIQRWQRPIILARSNDPFQLNALVGPPGGVRAKKMRGVCDDLEGVWYINGSMTPEIWVEAGKTYDFTIDAGPDHPFYITSEETGGWTQKPPNEKRIVRNFAGGDGEAFSQTQCIWRPKVNVDPDAFENYAHYYEASQMTVQCRSRPQNKILRWTVPRQTGILYYASYTAYNMGGPIRICGSIQGNRCV